MSKFTVKGFLMFTLMTGASLALLHFADGLSGGMVRKIGAR